MAIRSDTTTYITLRPPLIGVLVFWASCVALLLGFALHTAMGYVLLCAIVPIFYGAHEALHCTLLPSRPTSKIQFHNSFALCVGFALQGMNFRLLRPAHLRHHIYGRYDIGYAPDRTDGPRNIQTLFVYYARLFGACLYWQAIGMVFLFLPKRHCPLMRYNEYATDNAPISRWCAQLSVVAFEVYAIAVGGIRKWILFEIAFCCLWSLLQNVSHYGLMGTNDLTERVCAKTYILPAFWRLITFGSTAHLAHHLFPNIPGYYLHEPEVQRRVNTMLEGEVQITRGVLRFAFDIIRQLRGPVRREDLSTDWIKPGTIK